MLPTYNEKDTLPQLVPRLIGMLEGVGWPFEIIIVDDDSRSYREHDDNVRMWDTIRRGVLPYRLAQRFHARYLNWRFYTRLDPMYEGYFISPTIEIYQRVD